MRALVLAILAMFVLSVVPYGALAETGDRTERETQARERLVEAENKAKERLAEAENKEKARMLEAQGKAAERIEKAREKYNEAMMKAANARGNYENAKAAFEEAK